MNHWLNQSRSSSASLASLPELAAARRVQLAQQVCFHCVITSLQLFCIFLTAQLFQRNVGTLRWNNICASPNRG